MVLGILLSFVLTALAVVFLLPEAAATRYGYFDINNGQSKKVWVSFGRSYREAVEHTEYSRLLKALGFKESPAEWKLATQVEIGMRRFFYPYVDYYYGRIEADSTLFVLDVRLKQLEPAAARDLATKFGVLVQKGDWREVSEFVNRLERQQ